MRGALLLLALVPVAALAKNAPSIPRYASPGAVIGAEVGFNAAAREKGQWAAYKATAAEGAWLLSPELVLAEAWLKNRAAPSLAESWSPHAVWSSCDGTYAVTRGSWRNGSKVGQFVTLWQRQEDGGYKWALRQQVPVVHADPEPDMIAATVADCPKRKIEEQVEAPPPSPSRSSKRPQEPTVAFDPAAGASRDGTLVWALVKNPGRQTMLTVTITKNGAAETVVGTPRP